MAPTYDKDSVPGVDSIWVTTRASIPSVSQLLRFRDRDMNFYKEKLQAKITCKAGWLLGFHGSCLNPRDLEAALELVPELQGIPIEIRIEAI